MLALSGQRLLTATSVNLKIAGTEGILASVQQYLQIFPARRFCLLAVE
jgi:hypothetical protein